MPRLAKHLFHGDGLCSLIVKDITLSRARQGEIRSETALCDWLATAEVSCGERAARIETTSGRLRRIIKPYPSTVFRSAKVGSCGFDSKMDT